MSNPQNTWYVRRMPDIPGLVKASAAAKLLGVSLGTIYYQIQHGLIRYERVNGHYYLTQATIDKVLAYRKTVEDLRQARQCLDSAALAVRESHEAAKEGQQDG